MKTATPMTDALLYLNGVTVSFDGFKALNDLSLVVDEGELRTIIGPNGAGKTTMMDVVTGKTRPDAGQCRGDAIVAIRCQLSEERPPGTTAIGKRELQIVKNC